MKKFLRIISIICFSIILFGCTNNNKNVLISNPWIECNQDFKIAKNVAGFSFPLELKNSKVRAMKDMIEITYEIDPLREVTIRKAMESNYKIDKNGIADISGVYNNHYKSKTIKLYDLVPMNIKYNENKIYVANFSAETGLYSISAIKGLKIDELEQIFKMIETVETRGLYKIP